MSNKNLKVYKILFITEIKTLHLNVKFPCDIKMTWKRSNQSAQTQRVKVVDGKVNFNQTLKLNVSMYFDMTTNKFVQKKCIYSFLIFTQKGEKSAGSVTYDLADFFNKRVYEIDESFPLQKCPVKDAKVDMKIHYQESVQSGYDSMSQISMTSQLDVSSSNPLDLSQLNESKQTHSQKSNSTVQGTKSSEPIIPQKKQQPKSQRYNEAQNYGSLNESDVQSEEFKSRKHINNTRSMQDYQYSSNSSNKENKIGENIKGIQQVTYKLNDFVGKFKSNLSYELEQKKRKINQLSEQLQAVNELNKKLENQLKDQKNQKHEMQITLNSLKSNASQGQKDRLKKIQQLQRKLEQQKKSRQSLQQQLTNASSNQQLSGKYIKQLKQQFAKQQSNIKQQLSKVQASYSQQKKQKTEYQNKYKKVNEQYEELNQKYDRLLNKYENLEGQIRKRQGQIEQTRINLDNAVQNLVQSLSGML